MRRRDPITARDLASDIGIELPVLLAWLRENGHAAENGSYRLGDRDVDELQAQHLDELLDRDRAWRESDPRRMPPRPGRKTDGANPFRRRTR